MDTYWLVKCMCVCIYIYTHTHTYTQISSTGLNDIFHKFLYYYISTFKLELDIVDIG